MNENVFNPLTLARRRYLVTGASCGIGRATAILLSKLGAQVILVARNVEALEETKRCMNGEHIVAPFDLSSPLGDYQGWLSNVVNDFGKLNGLVHCAGKNFSFPLKAISEKSLQEAFDINVGSAFKLASVFRRRNISVSEHKSIVFLSSVMGRVGQPGASLYAATKGSIVALTKSLALELMNDKIRVNCVSPACVETKMTTDLINKMSDDQALRIKSHHPMGFGRPEDIANMIVFLLSDAAEWITGADFAVDGGYTAH